MKMSDIAFEKIQIFAPTVWKCKVPAESYNKSELLNCIESNYDLDSTRNQWGDGHNNWHHYYGDWSNEKFKQLNLDELKVQYQKIVENFISNLELNSNVDYSWKIVNVSANKTFQKMDAHDHLDIDFDTGIYTNYAAVHYLNFKKEHTGTNFYNPLTIALHAKTLDHTDFYVDNLNNSEYFYQLSLHTEEDDVIIFPSYMKHSVGVIKETENLRVTIAFNIGIKKHNE